MKDTQIMQIVLLDQLFCLYDNYSGETIEKKISIEYNLYNKLIAIAETEEITLQELLEYIYLYYINTYEKNNSRVLLTPNEL
jgi:hypothetical protein